MAYRKAVELVPELAGKWVEVVLAPAGRAMVWTCKHAGETCHHGGSADRPKKKDYNRSGTQQERNEKKARQLPQLVVKESTVFILFWWIIQTT